MLAASRTKIPSEWNAPESNPRDEVGGLCRLYAEGQQNPRKRIEKAALGLSPLSLKDIRC
jgi:hypothetical protein